VAEGDVVPLPYIEAGSSYSMAEDSAINVGRDLPRDRVDSMVGITGKSDLQ
jgi:hypothetical protein